MKQLKLSLFHMNVALTQQSGGQVWHVRGNVSCPKGTVELLTVYPLLCCRQYSFILQQAVEPRLNKCMFGMSESMYVFQKRLLSCWKCLPCCVVSTSLFCNKLSNQDWINVCLACQRQCKFFQKGLLNCWKCLPCCVVSTPLFCNKLSSQHRVNVYIMSVQFRAVL